MSQVLELSFMTYFDSMLWVNYIFLLSIRFLFKFAKNDSMIFSLFHKLFLCLLLWNIFTFRLLHINLNQIILLFPFLYPYFITFFSDFLPSSSLEIMSWYQYHSLLFFEAFIFQSFSSLLFAFILLWQLYDTNLSIVSY